MRASAVAGLVFANINDELLKKLTSKRSMASVPFGARYRLIDFPLSNLVNAGISSVGIITKENYRSLMDHVGSGVYWDLDRKSGGLYLLPPYLTSGVKRYHGTVDALYGARDYIDRCKADYIVICNADVISNIDISAAVDRHIENGADVTLAYHSAKPPVNCADTMFPEIGRGGRINKLGFDIKSADETDFCIGLIIISRELLLTLINDAHDEGEISFARDVLAKKVNKLKIYGYEHKAYAAVLDSTEAYYKASMDLLNKDVRSMLFNKERPIFTKTRDDMPTRYGTKAVVKNCFIADGCVIKGTVRNSIVFRGVTVEKDAVVENCILMQETAVGEGAQLVNVIADKNASVGAGMVLKGTAAKSFFIKKNQAL